MADPTRWASEAAVIALLDELVEGAEPVRNDGVLSPDEVQAAAWARDAKARLEARVGKAREAVEREWRKGKKTGAEAKDKALTEAEMEAQRDSERMDILWRRSFLSQYVGYALSRTDAPGVYHLGGALSVLASIIPPTMTVPGLPGAKPVPGNVFCLLVGRQGADRKSTAVEIAQQLLAEIDARRDGSDPGSAEAFDLSVQQQPQQTIYFSEMGDFFAKTKERTTGNYGTEVKTRLLRHFDRTPINKTYIKHPVRCPLPHVSVLGGINPALLVTHVPLNDWLNGLMSRFLVFWGRAERSLSRTSNRQQDADELCAYGVHAVSHPAEHFGACYGLSLAAHALWEEWDKSMQDTKEDGIGSTLVGARARAPYLAIRIALLVAFGEHLGWPINEPCRTPFYITTRHMIAAMGIATMAYTGSILIAEHATDDKDMQARRAVLDAVRTEWTPLGEITRGAKLLKPRAMPILQTLIEERLIEAEGKPEVTGKIKAQHYRKTTDVGEGGWDRDVALVQVPIPSSGAVDPMEAMNRGEIEMVSPEGTVPMLPPTPRSARPPQASRAVQAVVEGHDGDNENDDGAEGRERMARVRERTARALAKASI